MRVIQVICLALCLTLLALSPSEALDTKTYIAILLLTKGGALAFGWAAYRIERVFFDNPTPRESETNGQHETN